MLAARSNLSLKDFIHRRHILLAYRDCLRLVVKIEDKSDREYMWKWVQSTFNTKVDETDPIARQMMKTQANMFLKELKLCLGQLREK